MKPPAVHAPPRARVAYFSMEVGYRFDVPTYSGGLGVLAGDTLKAAADLGLPVVGITLVHRKGHFRQTLDPAGGQSVEPHEWSPEELLAEHGAPIAVELDGRSVLARAWRDEIVGQGGHVVPLYMLDTRHPDNALEDRAITDSLYGDDGALRLRQEAVLGLGGAALLRGLGLEDIETFHVNEGHSSLLALALLEDRARGRGAQAASDEERAAVRRRCVFTTHTPVPAGHDRFPLDVVDRVLGSDRARALAAMGGTSDGHLDMTRLALRHARFVNGVSWRHAGVSREMFPDTDVQPITNGVHLGTWVSPPIAELFDRHLAGWRAAGAVLRHAVGIPLREIRAARQAARARLFAAVRERTGVELDGDALTFGFARRATPYKRMTLLYTDPERLRRIVQSTGKLQVVHAGKAHPNDRGGQALIRAVHEAARALEGDVRVVYVQDYDMELGALMTSGVDVWLNTPARPKEASGTSGMKAAANGVPSFSVLDGWWIEGCLDGVTGWSIGEDHEANVHDAREAEDLYRKLEREVLPMFHRAPERFDEVCRNAIAYNGAHFSAERMVAELAARAWR